MAEPGLISDYLATLSAHLPPQLVEELADGLDQTYRHYVQQGLADDAAAEAAIAEFGEPQMIVAAFARTSPARHAARRLLATGPSSAPAGRQRWSPAGPGPGRSRPGRESGSASP